MHVFCFIFVHFSLLDLGLAHYASTAPGSHGDLFDVGGGARLSGMDGDIQAKSLSLLEPLHVPGVQGEELIACYVHSNHTPFPVLPSQSDNSLTVLCKRMRDLIT